MKSPKLNILITGAGGAAAIALQQNLAKRSDLRLFMADMDPCSSGLYLVPVSQRLLLPPGNASDYNNRLLSLCIEHNINVLIPTVDAELVPIAYKRADFEQVGVCIVSSSLSTLEICSDKFKLMEFLDGKHPIAGYAVYDQGTVLAEGDFPFIFKPRIGSGSRGIRLVKSNQDVIGIPRDGSYLVQEYLPGMEYSVDVYVAAKGRVIANVIRERLKVDSGIAVISQTIHNEALSKQAEQIATLLDIRYVANIQFRLNTSGQPRLLEINPRFPGTMPLTVMSGVDMPAMCIADVLQQPLKTYYPYQNIAMVRHWQEHFISPDELQWNSQ